jgi:hypothetical protein
MNYTISYNHFNSISGSSGEGILVAQDIAYDHQRLPFSTRIRLAHFDTDTHNNRIYLYENDVAGSGSMPSYSGRGFRFYLLFKVRLMKILDLWARYSVFIYPERVSLGSGNDMIDGNTRSEIKVQVRLRL